MSLSDTLENHPALPRVLLAVLAVAAYANALRNGYAIDDVAIILENPAVHGVHDWRGILFGWYWPQTPELWRPLTTLSFALGWQAFGASPAPAHLVNVLLHSLVTVLVYALLRRLGARAVPAVIGAAIFAVHPVHVEAVANLVGRAEMIAAAAVLVACLIYLRGDGLSALAATSISLCYLLGLAGKEIAVALPALLLLADLARRRAAGTPLAPAPGRFARVLPGLVAALGVFLVGRWLVLGSPVGTVPAPFLSVLTPADRIATAVSIWPEYLRLLFWPRDLAMEWTPATLRTTSWADPSVYASLGLVAALTVLAVRQWRRGSPWELLALAWFAVTVFPVSNIPFGVGVLIAERTLYLPSVGLVFVVPALYRLVAPASGRRKAGLALVTAAVLMLGAARTWTRTPVWASSEAVLNSMLLEHPESARAMTYGAQVMYSRGRYREAAVLWERAREIYGRRGPYIDAGLAYTYMAAGTPERAAELMAHTATYSGDPEIYLTWAAALLQMGRYEQALQTVDRVRSWGRIPALRSRFAHQRSLALDGLGRADESLAERRVALDDPAGRSSYYSWYHLARLHAVAGRADSASLALDSARVRAPAEFRPFLTLEPIPPLDTYYVRGFGPPDPRSGPPSLPGRVSGGG